MAGSNGHFLNDVLDANGDLILRITHSRSHFDMFDDPYSKSLLVDSRALSRASKKWTEMINTASQCGKGCRHLMIHIEGDYKSHEILLNIAHGHFGKVPESLDHVPDVTSYLFRTIWISRYTNVVMRQLFHVVCVADTFGELHLLRPWVPAWVKDYEYWIEGHRSLDSHYYILEECLVRLNIAWRLGEKEFLRQFTARMTEHSGIGVNPWLHKVIGSPLIYQVEGAEHMTRLLVHSRFQDDWAARLHRQCIFANATSDEQSACVSRLQKLIARAKTSCYAMRLKQDYILACRKPGKSPWQAGAMELMALIGRVTDRPHRLSPFKEHDLCYPTVRMEESLKKVLERLESPLDAGQEEFLDSRAKLTGADKLPIGN
ncbi:hypothetical protein PG984_007041 [Apiospora sp. TS-2023a]